MTANDLWTVESAFAVQYVSNPASGELVKGHRIVLALYRGLSFSGQRQARRNKSFTSATFNIEVAMDHFCDDDPASTCVLLRQPVPVEKLFMSYLETEQMNRQYKEAEAVLLHDAASDLF